MHQTHPPLVRFQVAVEAATVNCVVVNTVEVMVVAVDDVAVVVAVRVTVAVEVVVAVAPESCLRCCPCVPWSRDNTWAKRSCYLYKAKRMTSGHVVMLVTHNFQQIKQLLH